MYRRVVLILALAVAVAACGGSETAVEGVATLESGSGDAVANVQAMSDDEIEEAALAFTQCLRAEGLDVPDPEFDGEGGFTFDFRGAFRDGSGDGPNDEFQAALEVCEPLMEGVAQQFEPPDLSEIEDDLPDSLRLRSAEDSSERATNAADRAQRFLSLTAVISVLVSAVAMPAPRRPSAGRPKAPKIRA